MAILEEIKRSEMVQQGKNLSADEILRIFYDVLDDEEFQYVSIAKDSKEMIQRIKEIITRKETLSRDDLFVKTPSLPRMISCSPSKRYVLWMFFKYVFLFSEEEMWLVYEDILLDEGELGIHNVAWDEEAASVSCVLDYIVKGEEIIYKYFFTTQKPDNEAKEILHHYQMDPLENWPSSFARIGNRRLEVGKKRTILYRCQVELCEPLQAQDECFWINEDEDGSEQIIVKNVSYGRVSVKYGLQQGRTIDFSLNQHHEYAIKGKLKISISDNIAHVCAIETSELTLYYDKGESFVLGVGDQICNGSDVLLSYEEDLWEDIWEY